MENIIMAVTPKKALLNPKLIRPNWTTSVPRDENAIWVDKNENLDPILLEHNGKLLRNLDIREIACYPEFGPLYQKLATWVGLPPDYFMLTPGSDGAIRLTFECLVDEGDVVVHTQPTFAMYSVYCQAFGANAKPFSYLPGTHEPQLPLEDLFKHIEKNRPRLLCLPNPDSPTGTVISDSDLVRLVDLCDHLNTVILVDEAYHPFYENTCVHLTNKFKNLLVARTFAKAWGLAGFRIGYLVGNPETLIYLHKLRPMYEVNTVGAMVVQSALDHSQKMVASVKRLNEGKSYFEAEMKKLGYAVFNTYGNFIHIRFGSNADKVHALLKGIVLYRANFSDAGLAGYSRFSATTKEVFQKIVEIINKV
jgi:histidinol-phosphate aminotransferase